MSLQSADPIMGSGGDEASCHPTTWNFQYDVFLNFGEDTRKEFTGHLYDALHRKEIKVFMDDQALQMGDDISLVTFRAIEGSKISIIVFSENYASSRWCLDELVKILECMEIRGQLVLPVFYKVHPSIVRHQGGSFGLALVDHEKKYTDNIGKVKHWRSGLNTGSNLKGREVKGERYEYKEIQELVEFVWNRLNSSKGGDGKTEVSNVGTKISLFFGSLCGRLGVASSKVGDSSWHSGPAAPSTSSSKLGNGKAEAITSEAKNLVLFGNSSRQYDLGNMLRAPPEVVGTFGTSHKAVLEDGTVVAVERIREKKTLEKEFRKKIETAGTMAHENLLSLRGYYFSLDKQLLFYDYMPDLRSLSACLHGIGAVRKRLTWSVRLGIALGAASGIEYIHSAGPHVCHGVITSSNILLTKSYDAIVCEFGLALVAVPFYGRFLAYRAPELSGRPCNISQKADVYSFGVLLLEILTGKAPARNNETGLDLPRWVQSFAREEWHSRVLDGEIYGYRNADQIVQLIQMALHCTAESQVNRPSMSRVIQRIKEWR